MNRFLLTAAFIFGTSVTAICAAEKPTMSVVREIIVLPDQALEPTAVIRTPDDRLIVTGSNAVAKFGIATKIDYQGNVEWSYRSQQEKRHFYDRADNPEIAGAAVLENGNVLLCGNDSILDESTLGSRLHGPLSAVQAKFIRLDAAGQFIDKVKIPSIAASDLNIETLEKNASARLAQGYLQKCGRWGNSIYAVGLTRHIVPRPGDPDSNTVTNLLWVVRADTQGKVVWQKFLPVTTVAFDNVGLPQILPNGDLLVAVTGNNMPFRAGQDLRGTEIYVVSPDGKLTAQRNFNTPSPAVGRLNSTEPSMVSQFHPREGTTRLITLNASLGTSLERTIPGETTPYNQVALVRGNDDLVAFVETYRDGRYQSFVVRRNLTSGHLEELQLPQKYSRPTPVADVAAINLSGTFAALHRRIPAAGIDKGGGLLLTLIHLD